uniref:hypothetical protein n=1 Tax=uncultured Draconibacterium sp. TaxID=1573823 RepID=UPI003217A275
MIEQFFEIFESAVSPTNVAISFIVSIIASLIIGLALGNIGGSVIGGVVSFILCEIIFVMLYFAIRDKVAEFRYSEIKETMLSAQISRVQANPNITSWQTGLEAIKDDPNEIGYYIVTTDYLEKEKDYNSAALLIEMGLDFIKKSPIPRPLCDKLRRYYKYLENRPEINDNCEFVIKAGQ